MKNSQRPGLPMGLPGVQQSPAGIWQHTRTVLLGRREIFSVGNNLRGKFDSLLYLEAPVLCWFLSNGYWIGWLVKNFERTRLKIGDREVWSREHWIDLSAWEQSVKVFVTRQFLTSIWYWGGSHWPDRQENLPVVLFFVYLCKYMYLQIAGSCLVTVPARMEIAWAQ